MATSRLTPTIEQTVSISLSAILILVGWQLEGWSYCSRGLHATQAEMTWEVEVDAPESCATVADGNCCLEALLRCNLCLASVSERAEAKVMPSRNMNADRNE